MKKNDRYTCPACKEEIILKMRQKEGVYETTLQEKEDAIKSLKTDNNVMRKQKLSAASENEKLQKNDEKLKSKIEKMIKESDDRKKKEQGKVNTTSKEQSHSSLKLIYWRL